MNLHQLTGAESGVVLYTPDNAMLEGFVCNWSAIDGLPRIFATGLIGLGDGDVQRLELMRNVSRRPVL